MYLFIFEYIFRNGIVSISDPFYPCPIGTYLRKAKAGEPVFYNNYEQLKRLRA
jgi:hypothetical protein